MKRLLESAAGGIPFGATSSYTRIMRQELLDPVGSDPRRDEVQRLVREIFAAHEVGRDYTLDLENLARLMGASLGVLDVDVAFGSGSAADFADSLLFAQRPVQTDLRESELVEIIEKIQKCDGSESQIRYWLDCLRYSTKCIEISDLLFRPDQTSGIECGTAVTPREVLRLARERASKAVILL